MIRMSNSIMKNLNKIIHERGGGSNGKRSAREPERVPVYAMRISFYETQEGCCMDHVSQRIEAQVREVFHGMPEEIKGQLSRQCKPGEYMARMRLWKSFLKSSPLTDQEAGKALGAMLEWFIRCKQAETRGEYRL